MQVGLTQSQRAFAQALLQPSASVPAFLRATNDQRAASAFGVYRNNVASGLVRVMMARFPVIARLTGAESFTELAIRFIAQHPPRSPVLLGYGDDFPDFLRCLDAAPAADYLADIAGLEVARGHAFHAADAEPVALERYAQLRVESLPHLQVLLHPSVTLLRSRFPIVSAWEANQPGADTQMRNWTSEDAIVARPRHEVTVTRVPRGGFAFLSALAGGLTLATAIRAGVSEHAAFDLGANLAILAGTEIAVELRDV